MPVLPTRIHGLFDYFLGLILAGLPWLLEIEDRGVETLALGGTGMLIFLYNLVTDHELGLAPLLPLRWHLLIDFFVGFFLVAAPWMFDFAEGARLQPCFLGILLVASALLTSSPRERTIRFGW